MAGYPPPGRTNTLAILALVFAFVFPVLGIVFGAVGLRQIRQRREDGRGLALAGIIVGSIWTALALVSIVVLAVAVGTASSAAQVAAGLSSVSTPDGGGTPTGGTDAGTATDGAGTATATPSLPFPQNVEYAACQQVMPGVTRDASQLDSGGPQEDATALADLESVFSAALNPQLGNTPVGEDAFTSYREAAEDAARAADGTDVTAADVGLPDLENACTSVGYQP